MPPTIVKKAHSIVDQQGTAAAIAYLENLPEEEHDAESYFELGNYYRAERRFDEAIQAYEAAASVDKGFYRAFVAAAEVFLERGMIVQALDCCGCALVLKQDDSSIKEMFVMLARNARQTVFNPNLKNLLINCLATDNLDFSYIGSTVYDIMRHDPTFKGTLEALAKNKYEDARKAMTDIGGYNTLMDPIFVLSLKRQVTVPFPEFESVLTHLRHMLCDQFGGGQKFLDEKQFCTLAAALALYCFHVEYIFPVSGEENAVLPAFREKAAAGDKAAFCLLGCYEPLYTLPDPEKMASHFNDDDLKLLVKIQISDYLQIQAIRPTIPQLTKIDNETSAKVRAQYEESPYPRWVGFSKVMPQSNVERRLAGTAPRILVAGCGTGREAIELAYVFPDATVTAVDLSSSSLAYAIMRAKEQGVTNITFKQADILRLPEAGLEPFDFVASSGVIHHMKDPYAGWDILRGLMKPGGLMRLCLYSELSRGALYRARAVIDAKGYAATPEDIKKFRAEASSLLKAEDYKRISADYADYYTLAECRDLLFHVQERAFTMLEIKEYIEANGLRLLRINARNDIYDDYIRKNPGDPQGTNLTLWDKYERKNPKSFTGMYWFNFEKIA